jgi:hypothetical protein
MPRVTKAELEELRRDALPHDRQRLLELCCEFIGLAGAPEVEFLSDALAHWGRRFGKEDHCDVDALIESLADAGLRYRQRRRTTRSWTI